MHVYKNAKVIHEISNTTLNYIVFLMFYYSRSDSAYFDGLDETILCVGLVKAKPGKACYYYCSLGHM